MARKRSVDPHRKPTASRRPAPRGRRGGLVWLLPALGVALAVIVVTAIVHQRQGASPSSRGSTPGAERPLPADIARDLAAIPEQTWDRAPVGGVAPITAAGAPIPTAPVVLYVGAEYCPYCAVLRWSLVAVLNRFGRFTGLALSTSSATDVFPRTPTLTFLHQQYTSRYLTVQTVELQGNAQDARGQYPPLQRLTSAQAALFGRFDPSGSIPFLLIGGRYLLNGSPFSPALLQGMDWDAIAGSLASGSTPAAQAILSTGNEIAAAICDVDGEAPASVCRGEGVRKAAQTLPRAGH